MGKLYSASVHLQTVGEGENTKNMWYSEIRDRNHEVIFTSPFCNDESQARYGVQLYCKLNGLKMENMF